ncbi:MAG: phage major tail tube protein [Ewingella americana]|jgi:P2 family phage contractile tail tube protein|uniref:Phage major tail tube protein n=2 Tax=Ewingella americana TaxID=41202 RepID=A0A085GNQ0_EWIA3|nr:phage major tail tube protein [Ewingella americana]MDN5679620.1 phage major tail tube protein [Ewingella sp.]KAA8725502.1 phage major tail tube protein [Ewingella americana]KFC85345.1 phage major tail tube protein [Ewingella americana ATCC 33852]MCI1680018.1 phage major tail tube protein [Ewingella americana]MCI1855013.1 phage major tail tube protein [Ewingella americana]
MALPKKLKYLNLFNDGNSYLGVVSSLTLPKLTRKLENYRGGGMSGSVSVDFGLDDDALALEWTIGGMDELVLQQWGSTADIPLRFAGSFQRDDTGDISAVEVVMRGRHKEFDFGEYKQGEDTETKISTQCTYFKLTIDGKELIEVDTVNMVEIVNGVDRLAEHRSALGL